MQTKIEEIRCPNCASKNIKKAGIRKGKVQNKQQYFCKECSKVFTLNLEQLNKTYSLQTILKAVSLYNLGNSQTEIQALLRTNPKPSQKTISNWINEFKTTTTFNRLRNEAKVQFSPDNIIDQYEFLHNNLNYRYQIHNFKLKELTGNNEKLQRLKLYLEKITTKDFPHHIFKSNPEIKEKSDRASQTNFSALSIRPLSKQNLANKLCQLALNLAKSNKDRHQAIQDFMLTNDSTTIATEVPIYLTKDDLLYFLSKGFSINPQDYSTPVTGHIDILQIRNNLIHILDYKPEAKKQKPIGQLTIYALALASKTKLVLKDFKCAWFDENNYFEFFPLHVVYKKEFKSISKNYRKFIKEKSIINYK